MVSFEFKVFDKRDNFLQSMKLFLRGNVTSDCSVVSNQWFKNKNVIHDLRHKVKRFASFAESNKDNEKTKFIVSDSSEDGNTNNGIGAVIVLYEDGSSSEFEPPGQPGRPIITGVTHESVQLEWEQPEYGNDSIQHYSVLYRFVEDKDWKIHDSKATNTAITINDLVPEKKYEFIVRAECSSGSGKESKISEIAETKTSPHDLMLEEITAKSSTLSHGPPIIYKLEVRPVKVSKNVAKVEFGTVTHPRKPNRVLMVVGATGAGKSTLINGIVNYILGVKWEHKFRFKLIADEVSKSQAHSQTQNVTAYTFYWHQGSPLDYTLTVIDTPGFGDTEGLERDHKITANIREFFSIEGEKGIEVLDSIGFVTQASSARLTPTQKYISDSILSIFGKDIKNNIFIMTTFADGADPPVMNAIKEAGIPYAEFFPFNNSALFANSEFTKMFWQMGYSSFEKFFAHFAIADTVSLQMTRLVLEKRRQLQIIIQGIQPQIHAGLSKMDEIEQEERILKARESDILANKDFTYPIKVTKQKRIFLPPETFVTNCSICNRTCHLNCKYKDDSEKWKCTAMSGDESNAVCRVCDNKCSWRDHINSIYKLELSQVVETRNSQDYFREYICNDAKSKKDHLYTIISKKKKEVDKLYKEVVCNICKARECLQRLNEIALKPNSTLTEFEYIVLLIKSEKQQENPGWERRIEYLEQMKKNTKFLCNVEDEAQVNKFYGECCKDNFHIFQSK